MLSVAQGGEGRSRWGVRKGGGGGRGRVCASDRGERGGTHTKKRGSDIRARITVKVEKKKQKSPLARVVKSRRRRAGGEGRKRSKKLIGNKRWSGRSQTRRLLGMQFSDAVRIQWAGIGVSGSSTGGLCGGEVWKELALIIGTENILSTA